MIWRVEGFLLRDSEGGDGFGVVVLGEGGIGREIRKGGCSGDGREYDPIQRASSIEVVQCRRITWFGYCYALVFFFFFAWDIYQDLTQKENC